MLLGGRGAGKTRAGAEWVRAFVERAAAPARIALVSETYADGREVMIDGASGLSRIGPEETRPHYEISRRRLVWPSGSVGYVFSSEDPDGIRGHQFDAAWSDGAIDFIGIDYYPPLADWRDGFDHADLNAGWPDPYARAYIAANIEAGENYDWYYASEADRAAQTRTPITDAAHDEAWVWRAKDLRNWWKNAHHDRPGFTRSAGSTAWVPASKPIRFTETGCPAIDKGANAPNVFVDPKSSESARPPFSNGARDDLMQRRTLEAVHDYWRTQNETLGGVALIETDRLYVYAVDARPFPFFPARSDVWGDAANWNAGHWLNGRLTRAPLDALVAALCARGDATGVATDGNTGVDAGALKGALAGYIVDRPLSARQTIDPLADVFQFDIVETPAGLRFQPRGAAPVASLGVADFVDSEGEGAAFALTMGQKSDLPTAVRLGYIDEGGDYRAAVAEARFPGAPEDREAAFELPAVMDEASASARAASLLADAGVMRETLRFILPPSMAALEPGDAVTLWLGANTPGAVTREFRILSVSDGAARKVEAVRVSRAVYDAPVATGGFKIPASAPQFGKPAFELLNLPLLSDDDDPAAPWLAVYADPWPGAIALYREGALAATATARAVMGSLETALAPGVSGRWDNRSLRVRLAFGALASRSEEEIFAGANAAAIETPAGYEVMQFREARLEGDGAWTLTGLLRGQSGTEEAAAAGAAQGARFVLINGALTQAALAFDRRGVAFNWSAGPADDPPTEPTFRVKTFAGEATGAKPLAPVHLVAVETPDGDLIVSWKRRTRKGGDSWEGEDVPLGEAYERYRIEIYAGATLIRTAESAATGHVYAAAQIAEDFPPAQFPAGRPPLTIRVAQLSDAVGPGGWGEVKT